MARNKTKQNLEIQMLAGNSLKSFPNASSQKTTTLEEIKAELVALVLNFRSIIIVGTYYLTRVFSTFLNENCFYI